MVGIFYAKLEIRWRILYIEGYILRKVVEHYRTYKSRKSKDI